MQIYLAVILYEVIPGKFHITGKFFIFTSYMKVFNAYKLLKGWVYASKGLWYHLILKIIEFSFAFELNDAMIEGNESSI